MATFNRVLFLALILSLISTAKAFPETYKIVWVELERSPQRRTSVRQKFHAKLFKSVDTFAATLANPFTRTKMLGKEIVFDRDTEFAVFSRVNQSDDSTQKLALSDNGYWVFVKQSALQNIPSSAEDFVSKIGAFDNLRRYLPLKNNGKYVNVSENGRLGCNAETTISRAIGSELEFSVEWGIAKAAFGGDTEAKTEIKFPRGVQVTQREFGLEGTDQFISIVNEQFCGSHDMAGKHHYDIFLNGSLLGSLRPDGFEAKEYEIDSNSGRAKILCRKHRDSYFKYLIDELDLPDVWLQIVASTTARWPRGFEKFSSCQ